jgi:hypothetical protein
LNVRPFGLETASGPSIADYDERRAQQLEFWRTQNGKQIGDPAKLARALVTIVDQARPPLRFIAGAAAIARAEQTVAALQQDRRVPRPIDLAGIRRGSPKMKTRRLGESNLAVSTLGFLLVQTYRASLSR